MKMRKTRHVIGRRLIQAGLRLALGRRSGFTDVKILHYDPEGNLTHETPLPEDNT